MYHVSVTGLRLKSQLYAPVFWWHAIRSMRQAQKAEGVVSASTRTVNGVHHTLSVWQSKAHMMNYMRSGHHRKAMQRYASIATGSVYGYGSAAIPSWDEALDLWVRYGRVV